MPGAKKNADQPSLAFGRVPLIALRHPVVVNGDDGTPPEIAELLQGLDPAERDVLILRFGFDRGEPRTHDEVAELLGCSPEQVRAREDKAVDHLRKA